ncbi:MAG: hypothetical protein LC118_12675 [Dehalococcoidia bacterium]|nr:hypothetical protein [Dehalococcoidia bacterium]
MNAHPPRGKALAAGIAGGLALLAAGAAIAQTSGGTFDLSWHALRGGGTSSQSPYVLSGVAGQAVTGHSANGTFVVDSGFFAGGGKETYKRSLPNLAKDGVN